MNSPSERERGGRKKSEETEKVFGGWKGDEERGEAVCREKGRKKGRKEGRRVTGEKRTEKREKVFAG